MILVPRHRQLRGVCVAVSRELQDGARTGGAAHEQDARGPRHGQSLILTCSDRLVVC